MKSVRREAVRTMSSFFQAADFDPGSGEWQVDVTDETGASIPVLRCAFTPDPGT